MSPGMIGAAGLAKEYRVSYCPLCFDIDVKSDRLPYFRKSWANPYRTHCPLHRLPLFAWPHLKPVTGVRYIPENLVRQHMKLRLTGSADARSKLDVPLQLTRKIRNLVGQGEGMGFIWQQQLLWEQSLAGDNDLALIFGITPPKLKLVVNDLSTMLLSNFGERASAPMASHLSSFLGPRWLFGGHSAIQPAHSGIRLIDLRSVGNPARRRSVIALSLRILLSLYCDTSVSPEDCHMLAPGESPLIWEMKKMPVAAKQWLVRRSIRWPAQIHRAVLRVLE